METFEGNPPKLEQTMKRIISRSFVFIFGVLSYLVFLPTFLYLMGFTANASFIKAIDSGSGAHPVQAFAINTALIALFALQHVIMARPWFKRQWSRIIPEPMERSTFVLMSSIILILLFWLWQPIPTVLWSFDNVLARLMLNATFWLGWILVLYSSFLIDPFDLFGLRQVYLHLKGRPYTPVPFKVSSLYRFVRHPMMTGFFLALWSTPDMTAGRLLFAVELSLFILIGLHFEERDLMRYFGDTYRRYRFETSMVIPGLRRKARKKWCGAGEECA